VLVSASFECISEFKRSWWHGSGRSLQSVQQRIVIADRVPKYVFSKDNKNKNTSTDMATPSVGEKSKVALIYISSTE
jgi:hypothetical protein